MHPLEEALSYSFRNPRMLEQALTHPSLAKRQNNQRLEFLGDTVLGAIVAEILYNLYPTESEGELARRHAALVCGDTIAAVAKELNLGTHLMMASSEEIARGRENASNLEDACEALIGALFLDGGLEAARGFVQPAWEKLARAVSAPPKDAKTALQEWAQGRGLPVPAYILTERTGPAHAPQFTVQVEVKGQEAASATGASKRVAEQAAAKLLLGKVQP